MEILRYIWGTKTFARKSSYPSRTGGDKCGVSKGVKGGLQVTDPDSSLQVGIPGPGHWVLLKSFPVVLAIGSNIVFSLFPQILVKGSSGCLPPFALVCTLTSARKRS